MSEFFDPADKKNKPILDYFENRTWVILENSSSIRTSIKKTISQLGSKMSNMHDADNLVDAEKLLTSKKIHYIIGNNIVNGGSVTSLYNVHLTTNPNRMNCGFFVICEQQMIADAARVLDYEMDGIISAPFTGATILDSLLAGVKHKISPTPYLKKIEEGRDKYIKGQLGPAEETFNESVTLHKHPFESYYFLGKINSDNGLIDEAIINYEKSIEHNSECYKSLNNLSTIYYNKKDYAKAYNTNLIMTAKYPTPPDKIIELVRLSIINQKYEDIINYSKVFQSIKMPSPEMKISISAGLAILGKYFANSNDSEKCLDFLINSYLFCDGKYEILKSITESFQKIKKLVVLYNLLEKADIGHWPLESQGIYFHIVHIVSNDDVKVVSIGENLVRNKVREILVYKGLLERAIKMQRKSGYMDNLLLEASTNLPDLKDELEIIWRDLQEKNN